MMKLFTAFLLSLATQPTQVFACSEAGPRDFDIEANIEKTCGTIAIRYAKAFAKTMVDVEKKEPKYEGPTGGMTLEKEDPSLYTTKTRSGNSKLVGYNIGLNFKNKWECNFCVDMTLDEKGNCRIESVRKHMCAK